MGSTARQMRHEDSDRPSPQALARQLTQMDRDESTPSHTAAVTMLHGPAAATRTRKPRAARVKASEQAPANQVHGFSPRASTPAAAPITGQAPSLLRPESPTVTPAAAAPVPTAPSMQTVRSTDQAAAPARPATKPATARPGVMATIARSPRFVMDASRWAKHVMLGSGLAFMERVPDVLSPVAFVFANLITILIGLTYCALPAGMGLLLLSHSPALHDAFLVNGPMKVVYMGLLYITCGFVALVGAFALRALALGLVRTLNGFAAKGQTAFSD